MSPLDTLGVSSRMGKHDLLKKNSKEIKKTMINLGENYEEVSEDGWPKGLLNKTSVTKHP